MYQYHLLVTLWIVAIQAIVVDKTWVEFGGHNVWIRDLQDTSSSAVCTEFKYSSKNLNNLEHSYQYVYRGIDNKTKSCEGVVCNSLDTVDLKIHALAVNYSFLTFGPDVSLEFFDGALSSTPKPRTLRDTTVANYHSGTWQTIQSCIKWRLTNFAQSTDLIPSLIEFNFYLVKLLVPTTTETEIETVVVEKKSSQVSKIEVIRMGSAYGSSSGGYYGYSSYSSRSSGGIAGQIVGGIFSLLFFIAVIYLCWYFCCKPRYYSRSHISPSVTVINNQPPPQPQPIIINNVVGYGGPPQQYGVQQNFGPPPPQYGAPQPQEYGAPQQYGNQPPPYGAPYPQY